MADHDPLCPMTLSRYVSGTGITPNECRCALIAQVDHRARADERERIKADPDKARAEVIAEAARRRFPEVSDQSMAWGLVIELATSWFDIFEPLVGRAEPAADLEYDDALVWMLLVHAGEGPG